MRISALAYRSQQPAPIKGCSVHPNMLDKLRAAGLEDESILIDARPLLAGDSEGALLERGFRKEPSDEHRAIMALGEPQLYRAGQRAVFKEQGDVELLTFADDFLQIIRVDAEGQVTHNSVQRIPH